MGSWISLLRKPLWYVQVNSDLLRSRHWGNIWCARDVLGKESTMDEVDSDQVQAGRVFRLWCRADTCERWVKPGDVGRKSGAKRRESAKLTRKPRRKITCQENPTLSANDQLRTCILLIGGGEQPWHRAWLSIKRAADWNVDARGCHQEHSSWQFLLKGGLSGALHGNQMTVLEYSRAPFLQRQWLDCVLLFS